MATEQDANAGETVNDTAPIAENSPQTGPDAMHVKVYAPYKVYFDGQAKSISAVNQTGPFDILPKHHNFITLLVPCNVIVRTDKNEETIRIQNGIMHVKADSVVVFLDV